MAGVVILDAGGMIESCNTTIEALFGYAADDLIGRRLTMLMASPCDGMFPDALGAGDVTRGGFDCRVLGRHRDGSTFPMDIVVVALPPGDCPRFMGLVRDLTAREQQYEKSLKAKKLEAIGVLAGGIAHGLNNILTGILGNLSLAKTCTASSSKVTARLDAAEHACQRAADLAQQLLTFAKGGAPVRQLTSIATIIRDAAETALAGSGVNCELALPDALWPVDVDARQMRQVFHNILLNAVQAMPWGGTIHVRVDNLTENREGASSMPPGRYVTIDIQDQGSGIPPEHLEQIFEPFFTTKHPGHGLGLTIAQTIVAKHQGTLTVASVVGSGATFSLCLPASDTSLAAPLMEGTDVATGTGKVLVMDDEAAIRDIMCLTLTRMGYDVTSVADGAEAIRIYEQARVAGQPFALVILDVVVHVGMGGLETIAGLRQLDPLVKAIVCSGYANDAVMADCVRYGFSGMLIKPFTAQKLQDVVQRVLHSEPETIETYGRQGET